jgi:hypothetical protein
MLISIRDQINKIRPDIKNNLVTYFWLEKFDISPLYLMTNEVRA